MRELLSWTERFIATPSVSRDGNAAIAALAAELLEGTGLAVRQQRAPYAGPEQINVIAEAGPATGRDLLLITHLDTVPPGEPALWTATGGDPFRPTRAGDRLYGLGSADAKVDLVCKALGLAALDLGSLRRRVRVVGTFGEEIGLRGARHLVEQGETEGFDFALVGEPSELVAIHAHKGYAVFEARIPLPRIPDPCGGRRLHMEIEGASVHSSTPHLGRNAIEAAIDSIEREETVGLVDVEGGEVVNRVPDRCRLDLVVRDGPGAGRIDVAVRDARPLLSFVRAWRKCLSSLSGVRNAEFDPDHTVGSIGRIRVEDGDAIVTFDLRPVPGVDPDDAVGSLRDLATLHCVRSNPPLATPLDSPLVRAVQRAQERAGVRPALDTKPTCTEAGVLSGEGIEAVILGPGVSIGNVHRPNEHTLVSQLERAVEIYREVVRALCIEEGACSS
jgi:succinyl-diaminopimelate desuccinylase